MKLPTERYTVAVDFDGVIHSYTSPWINAHTIPDPPVDGAILWLLTMVDRFDVVIFTTRAKTWRGRRAVRAWLKHHADVGMWYDTPAGAGIERVFVTDQKVPALVYIDDRAWRFEGRFPTREEIHQARPWNKPREARA